MAGRGHWSLGKHMGNGSAGVGKAHGKREPKIQPCLLHHSVIVTPRVAVINQILQKWEMSWVSKWLPHSCRVYRCLIAL